ncbi:methyltransferase domain-containing protein [Microbulbifer salipaludis]|uniref:Methyltransferase domain-containing protein n=2 Tax=Microbulbifer salipaludis TaxID=187980 RepID=A0ABS3E6B6_9GAMM|nr:methyltransferase domain-containing protein [Microbulbifer salipaludis]
MFKRFMDEIQPSPADRILDVGVTPDLQLVDSNYFEALYPYRKQVTAVSIEDVTPLVYVYPEVAFRQVQPGPLPFADDEFDVVFCSAVLEHVGNFEQQEAFLAELLRVSKKFYITTPNRWYPVDFHTILPFIHWLPKGLHRKLLKLVGHDFLAREENLNLCAASDVRRMMGDRAHFNISYQWFLGLPSNILIFGESGTADA